MDNLIPVKDVEGLYRDANGVIHNIDKEGFSSYVNHRNNILKERERIGQLENDVSHIKDSITLILKLLQGN